MPPPDSPVLADQIYEDVASSLLADHCLDERQAWGVAGWPSEDILYGYRHQPVQPSRQTILKLILFSVLLYQLHSAST